MSEIEIVVTEDVIELVFLEGLPGQDGVGLDDPSVATTARALTLTETLVQWTPDAITLGGPEDFDGDQATCESYGFLYDGGNDTCGVNGAVTTYETNSEVAYLTLPIVAGSIGKVYWISNVHATRHGYVVLNASSTVVARIEPETSVLVFNNGTAWVLFDTIDGGAGGASFSDSAELLALISDATGTGLAVFNDSPTFVTPVLGAATGTSLALAKGITFTGATYTPSGATQAVNLADVPHFRLLLTSGSGTLTATLTVPAAMSSGIMYVKQHATTQRDLVVASATTISWLGSEPDWVAAAVGTEWAIHWSYDGVTLHLQGETGTDLDFTRDLNSVTVTSSTGASVELPAATTSLSGVLTAAKLNEINNNTQLLSTYAMLVNTTVGWATPTYMTIAGGDGDWTDPALENWQLGYWSLTADEESGNAGPTKLEVHAIDGAYFEHAAHKLGLKHDLSTGAEYIVSHPSKFRTTLGLGSMAVETATNYLALATGGTMVASVRHTEVTNVISANATTVVLNNGNHQTIDLAAATGAVTVNLTVPTTSTAGTLILKQDDTARDVTWTPSSGSVKWAGTEPTWASDAVSSIRIVSWRWDGSFLYLAPTEVMT